MGEISYIIMTCTHTILWNTVGQYSKSHNG